VHKLVVAICCQNSGKAACAISTSIQGSGKICLSVGHSSCSGLSYETAAFARCIAAGKTEAPQYTVNEALTNARVVDEIHSQIGVQPL
jgi:hypothetical protein